MIEPKTILAVLLVEDSRDDAEIVSRPVKAIWPASKLDCVGSLKDAAIFLSDHKPEVILLDLNLPNGAGVKVVQAIRAMAESSLLIVVTGHPDLHTAEEAIKSEADGYISKDDITHQSLSLAIIVAVAHREREDAKLRAFRKSMAGALTEAEKKVVTEILDRTAQLTADQSRLIKESIGIANGQK